MKMIKSLYIASLILTSLSLTQCNSAKSQIESTMELQQPEFAESKAQFNTYRAGQADGGSGIEFYLMSTDLPADVVLEQVYFHNYIGKLIKRPDYYIARFRTDGGKGPRDMIMSSKPEEEAVNTPPEKAVQFPFPLQDNEAGISYRENGVLKYAKIIGVTEKESKAYPSMPPQ